jgi:uncharacterized membrane protein YeaQ/YmgE (transglycosylase-associated protein family)
MSIENTLAWIAIGAAASLAGMIWPFRRGAVGVVLNLLAGILGALLAGLLSYVVLPRTSHGETPARLTFAALGALAMLGLVHAAWLRMTGQRSLWMGKRPSARDS